MPLLGSISIDLDKYRHYERRAAGLVVKAALDRGLDDVFDVAPLGLVARGKHQRLLYGNGLCVLQKLLRILCVDEALGDYLRLRRELARIALDGDYYLKHARGG